MRSPPLELLFQWLFKGGANRERERNRKRQRQRERIDETAGCRHFFFFFCIILFAKKIWKEQKLKRSSEKVKHGRMKEIKREEREKN